MARTRPRPKPRSRAFSLLREIDAKVVGFHDQRHGAIDGDCNEDADCSEHQRLRYEIGSGDAGKRDRHDLRREDEVGPDRAGNFLVLERLGVSGRRCCGCASGSSLRSAQHVMDLLEALVAEIKPAEHQKRSDRARQKGRQQQRGRQKKDQLVLERPKRDASDDRQFALGGKVGDVARRYGSVVDDHAGRFRARLDGLPGRVVERRRREFRQCYDVVQQCQQAAHVRSIPVSFITVRATLT